MPIMVCHVKSYWSRINCIFFDVYEISSRTGFPGEMNVFGHLRHCRSRFVGRDGIYVNNATGFNTSNSSVVLDTTQVDDNSDLEANLDDHIFTDPNTEMEGQDTTSKYNYYCNIYDLRYIYYIT